MSSTFTLGAISSVFLFLLLSKVVTFNFQNNPPYCVTVSFSYSRVAHSSLRLVYEMTLNYAPLTLHSKSAKNKNSSKIPNHIL